MTQQPSADDVEEVVGPVVAAIVGILLTGLLYLLLPSNVIIGPNWLLLVIEGVFVIPLLIDILTPLKSFAYGQAYACAGTPQPELISTRCRGCSLRFHTGNQYQRHQFVTRRSLALVFQYSGLRFVVLGN